MRYPNVPGIRLSSSETASRRNRLKKIPYQMERRGATGDMLLSQFWLQTAGIFD
jgi:hypothetical protein